MPKMKPEFPQDPVLYVFLDEDGDFRFHLYDSAEHVLTQPPILKDWHPERYGVIRTLRNEAREQYNLLGGTVRIREFLDMLTPKNIESNPIVLTTLTGTDADGLSPELSEQGQVHYSDFDF